jgi:hypothetical protein
LYTSEDDQAPVGVGEKVAECYVYGLHKRAVQPLHHLIGPASALRAGINDQITLRFPIIAAAWAVEFGRGCLAIRQMDFPLDLGLGVGDLAHLCHDTRIILGVFIHPKACALTLDPSL